MHDSNLLFSNNQTISSTNTRGTTVLDISTFPVGGAWIEIAYTAAAGTAPQLQAQILYSDDALAGAVEEGPQTVIMTATGGDRKFVLAHSRRRYAAINYLVSGTDPTFSNVTAGVVSGPQREGASASW